ncbi:hypothetical protein ACI65C_013852 [Semiaphis heraclei]
MFSKFVCLTFNIEIEVSDVEDDSMENNSIYNQTNNYEDTIHEDGEENIVLFTEQKKPSKQSGIWTEQVIKQLIAERTKLSKEFMYAKKKGQKNKLWEKIAKVLHKQGYTNFTATNCDDKWRGLLNQFRKVHDASKKTGGSAIKWKFYKQIEEAIEPIGKKQAMSPPRNILKESSTCEETLSQYTESTPTRQVNASTSVAISPGYAELPSTTPKSSPEILPLSSVKGKSPGWFQKYQEQKTEQTNLALRNANELHNRLDKMEKREEEMIAIQRHLVSKLEDANNIELQKLEVFKQMFNKQ